MKKKAENSGAIFGPKIQSTIKKNASMRLKKVQTKEETRNDGVKLR